MKKGVVVKPTVTSGMNRRCQVDSIDMKVILMGSTVTLWSNRYILLLNTYYLWMFEWSGRSAQA